MKTRSVALPRRDFIKIGSAIVITAAISTASRRAAAQGKPPLLDEKDGQAQALGYRADSTRVDNAKFPKHAATQACSNCAVYQGKAGDASGPCQIFAGKAVAAKGWCSAWVKKA